MQFKCLVSLTVSVLMFETCSPINLGSILNLGGNSANYKNGDGAVPTRISTIEKVFKALLLPIEAVENTTQTIEKGVNEIIEKLPPSLRGPIKNDINNGKRGFGDLLNLFSDRFHAIYPGTLWCGAGDIAKNKQDLGVFKRTDACCREHDNCFSNIVADEEKDGLLNNGLFTRSHCSCDKAFYDCLKNARSIIATKIGITYFDILNPQCFMEDYPIVNCTKHFTFGLLDDKCIEYAQDYNAKKKVQWFDNPSF